MRAAVLLVIAGAGLLMGNPANPPVNQPCNACHTGTLTNPGRVMIQVQSLQYRPGIPQEILVHVLTAQAPGATGFAMTARLVGNPAVQAGAFTAGQFSEVVDVNGAEVIRQSAVTGTNAFTFTWTPPATDVGPIRLSVQAVAGGLGDQTPNGNVFTGEYIMQRADRDLPAGFRWTEITVPGLEQRTVGALSNNGTIAGSGRDSTGAWKGFVRAPSGAITMFDPPVGAQTLEVHGVNDAGVAVGAWQDGESRLHGFVRRSNNTVESISPPGASSTRLDGINNAEQVVATLQEALYGVVLSFPLDNFANGQIVAQGTGSGGGISETGVIGGGVNRTAFLSLNGTLIGLRSCGTQLRGGATATPNDLLDVAGNCSFFGTSYFLKAPNGRAWELPEVSIAGGINNARQTVVNRDGVPYLLTPCAANPAATTVAANANGGTVNVNVNTLDNQCRWIAVREADWITVGQTGTGPGALELTLAPNPTSAPRTGIVFVAGAEVAVTQAGAACSYTLQGSPATFPGTGGTGVVNVTAPVGCAWNPGTNAPWLQVTSGLSGSGSGTLSFSVTANDGPQARTASIQVGNTQFTVIQSGAPACVYDTFPLSLTMPPGGGSALLTVLTGGGCPWTVTTTAAWLTLENATGSGQAAVTVVAQANTTGSARAAVLMVGGRVVNVVQSASGGGPVTSGLRFIPMTPCRLADTRENNSRLGKGATRAFAVMGAQPCNVPATAKAYSLNITVVPDGAYLGYVTAFPTGQPRPLASTLNSWNGRVVANAAIVPAGTGGLISLYADDPTHIVIDINGYFVEPTVPGGLAFYPLTRPCRVADTRGEARLAVIGPITRSFAVRGTEPCDVPDAAQAYALNVTVIPDIAVSFLTAWPTGQARPLASTLNSFDGQVVPNLALVPAGVNGEVSVFTTDGSDVVVDITGYFAPPSQLGALSYRPLVACRVADTRTGLIMPAQSQRDFPVVTAGCGVPATARGVVMNATAVPAGFLAYVTLWPAGFPQPLASTLNSWNGQVVANATLVPLGLGGAVSAYVTNPTHLVLDVSGYFEP